MTVWFNMFGTETDRCLPVRERRMSAHVHLTKCRGDQRQRRRDWRRTTPGSGASASATIALWQIPSATPRSSWRYSLAIDW